MGYTCSQVCGFMSHVGAGACRSGVLIDSQYLTTIKNMGNMGGGVTVTSVNPIYPGSNPYIVPVNMGGTILYPGNSSCTSSQIYQFCACDYTISSLPTPPVPISTSMNNFTSAAMNSYGMAVNFNMPWFNGNTPRELTAFDKTPSNGFSSIAMDANNNIYYTISGAQLQTTVAGDVFYTPQSAPYLYVIYYPYTGQPQYTGISTCAYVFDNRVNVFCMGSAGLIRVV